MSIKGGESSFSWVDYIEQLKISPTVGIEEPTAAAPVTEEREVWISKSAQEIARDMAALLLILPSLNPTLFREISQDIKKFFSIENVSGAGEAVKTFAPILVEQQIVLSMLDKWNQSIQDASEIQKEDTKEQDIKDQAIKFQQAAFEISRGCLNKIASNQDARSSPVVSTIIGSLLTNIGSLQVASKTSPIISAVTGMGESIPLLDGVSQAALTLASVLSLGVISTAATWATPVAMALSKSTSSPEQVEYDAAKAYAVSLSAFLMNPSFENFFSSQLDGVLSSGGKRG
jgi:hypothetical protein